MNRSHAEARRAVLRRLIADRAVRSQADAVRLLGRKGYQVTQTTVSRDLAALGAEKATGADGDEHYVLAGLPGNTGSLQELAALMRQFVVRIADSGNLALIETTPGAAGPVASTMDHAKLGRVLGTLAGDDTILVVADTAKGGAAVARRLQKILEEVRR